MPTRLDNADLNAQVIFLRSSDQLNLQGRGWHELMIMLFTIFVPVNFPTKRLLCHTIRTFVKHNILRYLFLLDYKTFKCTILFWNLLEKQNNRKHVFYRSQKVQKRHLRWKSTEMKLLSLFSSLPISLSLSLTHTHTIGLSFTPSTCLLRRTNVSLCSNIYCYDCRFSFHDVG